MNIIKSSTTLKYKILMDGKILVEDLESYDVAQIFLSKLQEDIREGAIVMGYTDTGETLLTEGTN